MLASFIVLPSLFDPFTLIRHYNEQKCLDFAFLAAVVDLIMDQKHLYKNPFSFTEACLGVFFVCLLY